MNKEKETEQPAAEQLSVRRDQAGEAENTPKSEDKTVTTRKKEPHHPRYRPTHKGTFIGLLVVASILIVNGIVIWVVMSGQTDSKKQAVANGVTLSEESLDKIGVSRNAVGGNQTKLFIGPATSFDSEVTIKGNVTVAGKLTLNNTFSATNAEFSNLQAGKTQLQNLNVNGDSTLSSATLRNDLQVAGTTRLQGTLTVNQLTTINNNLNVAGSLAVGGSLSTRNFQASSLTSDTTLTIGGHVITRGNAPGVSGGNALGTSGTVSISGSDTAGTVAANIGGSAGGGMIATIGFRQNFSGTPKVVVTPIGRSVPYLYVNRSAGGFSINTAQGLPPGSYAFDYIIFQ